MERKVEGSGTVSAVEGAPQSRRKFIQRTAIATVGLAAGCAGSADGSDGEADGGRSVRPDGGRGVEPDGGSFAADAALRDASDSGADGGTGLADSSTPGRDASSGGHSFLREITFSDGPDGADAWDNTNVDNGDWIPSGGGGGVYYDTRHAQGPSLYSGRCSISAGGRSWGFGLSATRFVDYDGWGKGDEVWWQVRVYIPDTWMVTDGQKFMRIPTSATPSKTGFFLKNQRQPSCNMHIGSELNSSATVDLEGLPLTRNQVHTFEVYSRADNVRSDRGGMGEVRIWHNHTPIRGWDIVWGGTDVKFPGYNLPLAALQNPSDRYSGGLQAHLAFNNGAPQDMDMWHLRHYVCDQNHRPPNLDSNGFPYIGPY